MNCWLHFLDMLQEDVLKFS